MHSQPKPTSSTSRTSQHSTISTKLHLPSTIKLKRSISTRSYSKKLQPHRPQSTSALLFSSSCTKSSSSSSKLSHSQRTTAKRTYITLSGETGNQDTPESFAKTFYSNLQQNSSSLQQNQAETHQNNPNNSFHPYGQNQAQQADPSRTQLDPNAPQYYTVHDSNDYSQHSHHSTTTSSTKSTKFSHFVPPSQDAGYITMSPRIEQDPTTFARRMITYWFQDYQRGQMVSDACRKKWFLGHPILDKYMVYEFGADFEAYKHEKLTGSTGPYSEIERHPLGGLSLIILITQYPKSHLRLAKAANGGILTPEIVATSHFGPTSKFLHDTFQEMVYNSIQSLHPLRFDVIERLFFFLPLLSVENTISQKIATARLSDLVDEAPRIHKPFLTAVKEFGLAHLDVIQQFGRFPQRNKLMARESTENEREYLRLHTTGWDPVDIYQTIQDTEISFYSKKNTTTPQMTQQQQQISQQLEQELAMKPRNAGAWKM